MTDGREHVPFETLNDYLDGVLDETSKRKVSKHMSACSECTSRHLELRQLLEATALLPRSVLPEADIWPELRESLERRKDAVLPVSSRGSTNRSSQRANGARWWQAPAFLGIAATMLVLASSSLTAIVLRGSHSDVQFVRAPRVPAPDITNGLPVVLPGSFSVTEGQYSRAIHELAEAVDAQRTRLSPATVGTVDHSLAVIDSAIAEARGALIADPGNATLVDLLSASYQRKLDLLRRTSELASRT